jgi:hypothetical protein
VLHPFAGRGVIAGMDVGDGWREVVEKEWWENGGVCGCGGTEGVLDES